MLRGVPGVWCLVCAFVMVGAVLGVFAVLTTHAGATTVVRTQAYYVQALSDIGGHRRMVRTRSRPETYVTFVTVGGSQLEYRASTDLDGKGPWSKPTDPLPSKVRAIENETLAVTFLFLDGKPVLFTYQGFYGTTGVSRWNAT